MGDHAGGRRSCIQDHVGGRGSCWLWKIVSLAESLFGHRKNTFFAQNGPLLVRSQHKSQQTICQLAADLILYGCWGQKIAPCRDNAEKIQRTFYKAFLNNFPQPTGQPSASKGPQG